MEGRLRNSLWPHNHTKYVAEVDVEHVLRTAHNRGTTVTISGKRM